MQICPCSDRFQNGDSHAESHPDFGWHSVEAKASERSAPAITFWKPSASIWPVTLFFESVRSVVHGSKKLVGPGSRWTARRTKPRPVRGLSQESQALQAWGRLKRVLRGKSFDLAKAPGAPAEEGEVGAEKQSEGPRKGLTNPHMPGSQRTTTDRLAVQLDFGVSEPGPGEAKASEYRPWGSRAPVRPAQY